MRVLASFVLVFAAGLRCCGADCLLVASGAVRASDLAPVAPAFASLDPETPLAAAPFPGVRRVVGPQEIRSWARRAGIELEVAPSVCIQRAEAPLEADRVEHTLAESLAAIFGEDTSLSWKLISFRPPAVPPGELAFLRGGLTKAGAGWGADLHLWRGRLRYDEGRHSLPVVVTLRLSRRRPIAKAAVDLATHTRLEENHILRTEIEDSPLDLARYADPVRLAGRTLRRAVPAGVPVAVRDLEPVYAVERGSDVTAEASVGGARIAIPAIAQSSVTAGQRVLLRNPQTKRTFTGRVVGEGRVEVDTDHARQAGSRRKP